MSDRLKSAMHTYSFRAECLQDVLDSIEILRTFDAPFKLVLIKADQIFPDCEVEIRSALGTTQIIELLRGDNELRTIRGTLRPCPIAENSMVRDYEIE